MISSITKQWHWKSFFQSKPIPNIWVIDTCWYSWCWWTKTPAFTSRYGSGNPMIYDDFYTIQVFSTEFLKHQTVFNCWSFEDMLMKTPLTEVLQSWFVHNSACCQGNRLPLAPGVWKDDDAWVILEDLEERKMFLFGKDRFRWCLVEEDIEQSWKVYIFIMFAVDYMCILGLESISYFIYFMMAIVKMWILLHIHAEKVF